jgi:hypothetical protein
MKFVFALALCAASSAFAQETIALQKIAGTDWAVWSNQDAITDRTNAEARLWSRDRRYQFVFRCVNSGQRPDIAVTILLPFDAGDSLSRVTLRYDAGKPESSLWRARNEQVFGFYPEDYVQKLRAAKSVVVRVDDRRLQGHDAVFSPTGVEKAVGGVFTACGKKQP